jgi:hypothetical protein
MKPEQRDEAFRLTGKTALHWRDILDALQRVPGIKSERTASRVLKDLKDRHLVVQNLIHQYVIP